VQLEELKARATQKAQSLPGLDVNGTDRLRSDLSAFFGKIPEPPVYRRHEDPARQQATVLLTEGEELLARAVRADGALPLWHKALELHLKAQCFVADGRIEAAEAEWREALALEQRAATDHRIWKRSDEQRPPVFRSDTGESRFDPRPEPSVQLKLSCPSCRAVHDYAVTTRHATHSFDCVGCRATFWVYLAELRELEIERRPDGTSRRYLFRVDELQGGTTRIHFDDVSNGELSAARRDLIAFIYAPSTTLRGVLNLSSGRVLWVTNGGPCFVATVAFGEGAVELEAFRQFRDRVLMPHVPGVVAAYYAHGPALARWVERKPLRKWAVRAMLRGVYRVIA
jgi:hypothetical protein